MEHGKHQHTHDDHGTFQDDKVRLVAHELATPAIGEFRDTVDASNVDTQETDYDGEDEASERCLAEECHCSRRELIAAVVGADGVLDEKGAEDGQNDDLEDDTGHHEICSEILQVRAAICCSSNATAGTLENEREDVTSDEDARVPHRRQA